MTIRRYLPSALGNAFAFLFTICIGMVAGSFLSVSDAVDEQLSWKKRQVAAKHHTR